MKKINHSSYTDYHLINIVCIPGLLSASTPENKCFGCGKGDRFLGNCISDCTGKSMIVLSPTILGSFSARDNSASSRRDSVNTLSASLSTED